MVLTRTLLSQPLYRTCRCLILTRSSKAITGYKSADDAIDTVTGGKIYKWLDAYENIVGLTEVKQAQTLVTEAEAEYRLIQEKRRSTQQLVTNVQSKIKAVAQDIEKTQRGTDSYIELVTRENEIIKDEKQILDSLYELDELEKHHFALLSSAVRESHEKERMRAERVKYWSLSATVIGAFVGIMGTTITNYYRMKNLRKIVSSSSQQTLELYKSVNEQYSDLRSILSGIRPQTDIDGASIKKSTETKDTETVMNRTDLLELTKLIQNQETMFKEEMESLKKLVSVKAVGTDVEGNVVYNSEDIELLLKDTERSLEWKMKLQSLGIVTLVYAVGAVTIPILVKIFSGSS